MTTKTRGPFLIVHRSKETYVYWRGRLIHKRWHDCEHSKTFDKYGIVI